MRQSELLLLYHVLRLYQPLLRGVLLDFGAKNIDSRRSSGVSQIDSAIVQGFCARELSFHGSHPTLRGYNLKVQVYDGQHYEFARVRVTEGRGPLTLRGASQIVAAFEVQDGLREHSAGVYQREWSNDLIDGGKSRKPEGCKIHLALLRRENSFDFRVQLREILEASSGSNLFGF